MSGPGLPGGFLSIGSSTLDLYSAPKHVVRIGKTPVLTADQARQLLDSIDTATIVAVSENGPVAAVSSERTLILYPDPSFGMAEQISRCCAAYCQGCDSVWPPIFQLTQKRGKWEAVLYGSPESNLPRQELIRRIQAEGFAPATLDDCFEIAYRYPKVLDEPGPIIFLGSSGIANGQRVFPVLGWGGGARYLSVDSLEGTDKAGCAICRFAAVRERNR